MQVIELLLKCLEGEETIENLLEKTSTLYHENISTSDSNLFSVLSELNKLQLMYAQHAFSSLYIQIKFTTMLDKLVN